jgi:hypothetical protein
MATIELREPDKLTSARAKQLVAAAIELNRALGDPTAIAR